MINLFSIIVPVDIEPLSQNSATRCHPRTMTKRKHKAMHDARVCWIAAGRPTVLPEHWPVTVDAIVRRGNLMDEWNIPGALKYVIDSIFKDGATPDDAPRYVSMGRNSQVINAQYKHRPEVEFIVKSECGLPVELKSKVSADYATLVAESISRARTLEERI